MELINLTLSSVELPYLEIDGPCSLVNYKEGKLESVVSIYYEKGRISSMVPQSVLNLTAGYPIESRCE